MAIRKVPPVSVSPTEKSGSPSTFQKKVSLQLEDIFSRGTSVLGIGNISPEDLRDLAQAIATANEAKEGRLS